MCCGSPDYFLARLTTRFHNNRRNKRRIHVEEIVVVGLADYVAPACRSEHREGRRVWGTGPEGREMGVQEYRRSRLQAHA